MPVNTRVWSFIRIWGASLSWISGQSRLFGICVMASALFHVTVLAIALGVAFAVSMPPKPAESIVEITFAKALPPPFLADGPPLPREKPAKKAVSMPVEKKQPRARPGFVRAAPASVVSAAEPVVPPSASPAAEAVVVSSKSSASTGSGTEDRAPAGVSKGGNEGLSMETSWAGSGGGQAGHGRSGSPGAASMRAYLDAVRARVEQHKKYPEPARRREVEGRVVVCFDVGPNGGVGGLSLLEKSWNGLLNEAALNAVREAAPLPDPPREGCLFPLPVKITLVFSLQ